MKAWQQKGRTAIKHFFRNKLAFTGGVLVSLFLLAALLAPWIAPHDPYLNTGVGKAGPSWDSPLGTDQLGRDVLSRIIYGSRISLQIAVFSVSMALIVGCAVGLFAGYYGGIPDTILMRMMDGMLAMPSILLAIVVVAILGQSFFNVMIAIAVVFVPQFARVLRSAVLSVRERDYVLAARALGAGDWRIVTRAVLPNCLGPLIVQATLGLGTAILDAAGLNFLGLGGQIDVPEWGTMIIRSKSLFLSAWWVPTAPGIAIFLTVMGFNLLGDGLRDIFDPQLRHRR